MLRIGIAADSHGDWSTLDRWASGNKIGLVIHCGDCGVTPSDGVPVWAARGNHDLWDKSRGRRPRFIADYRVVQLEGLRWLFLGCSSGLGHVAPPPAEMPAADVLISHEAPFNPHLGWSGHPVVRAVIERIQPRWCFSGHWHQAGRATLGPTTCYALGADPSGWVIAEVHDG